MAKNYTFAEAVKIISEGKNAEAIVDVGRRYPLLMHYVTKVAVLAGDEFVKLMSFMPDYLTANKVNTAIKNAVNGGDTDTDDDEDDMGEIPSTLSTANESDTMPDYTAMSGKELWNILGEAGARKTAKSTKKTDLVAACEALWKSKNAKNDEDDTDDENEASESKYDGKSAMELFKLCKSRGIKAAAKKTAKYYADLLTAADAEEKEDESEDWEDESETSKTTSKGKKATSKSSKKEEATKDDDDDDDWDI